MKISQIVRVSFRHALVFVALFLAALTGGMAQAATWPEKTVKFVVCFPPGNAADVFARSVSPELSERLGQSFVVDNRAGAGGLIGMEATAKARPDGYSVGVCSLSPITILPAVRKNMPYDVEHDLIPVVLSNKGPMVLVVKKDSPFNTLDELIAYAKQNPGKLTYASLGPGTISQMSTEAFKMAAGIDMMEISYKGSGSALTDLIGGRINVMLDGAATAMAQMAAGTVKALAVTTLKRSPLLPQVPAMSESDIRGLEGFDFFGWVGFFVPTGTPSAIVQKLNKEIAQTLKLLVVQQRANATGQEIAEPNTPEQFRDFIRKDHARWAAIAQKLKLDLNE